MNTKLLEHIGLTEEQAKIYICLVNSGTLPARKIALQTLINRSLVYKILKELVTFELVTEISNPKGVSTFTALHPSKLHTFLQKKEENLRLADQSYHEAVQTLGAQYNLSHKKPTIRFYEGVSGIKFAYKDILHTHTDILIIRSQHVDNTPELQSVIDTQIRMQVEKGIHTKAIVPTELHFTEETKNKDVENLITRRRTPLHTLQIPALVIIYGNKVSMTSFGENIITTIIEDSAISETYKMIFERLWETSSDN